MSETSPTLTEINALLNAQNVYNKNIVCAMSSAATIATSTAKLTCGAGVSADKDYYKALTNTGKFAISVDGSDYTAVNPDFSSVTSMADVATAIQTGIRAATSGSETCAWSTDHFVITSGTAGASGSISYLSTPASGVDISDDLGGRSNSAGASLLAAGETYSSKALFTVTGKVRVKAIYGVIGTVIETSANATKLVHTPTGGAAGDLCTTLDITAKAAGSFLYLTAPGSAMVNSATLALNLTAPYTLDSGKISLVCSASKTGSIKWTVVYEAIESGATVTDCHTS